MARKKSTKPKPAEKSKVKIERAFEELLCQLAGKELLERAQIMADLMSDRQDLEAEKKRYADHFKSLISELDSKLFKIRTQISDRAEVRQVGIERHLDYGIKEVRFIRTDTGEVYHKRDMTTQEMQLELEFQEQEV